MAVLNYKLIAPPIKAPRISNPPITCKTRSYHASLFLPEIPLQNKSKAMNSPAIPWPTRWVSRGSTGETGDHIPPVRFFFGRFGILLQSVLPLRMVGEKSRFHSLTRQKGEETAHTCAITVHVSYRVHSFCQHLAGVQVTDSGEIFCIDFD
jgi:hypothetical protein